jgi:hypothetical protein
MVIIIIIIIPSKGRFFCNLRVVRMLIMMVVMVMTLMLMLKLMMMMMIDEDADDDADDCDNGSLLCTTQWFSRSPKNECVLRDRRQELAVCAKQKSKFIGALITH